MLWTDFFDKTYSTIDPILDPIFENRYPKVFWYASAGRDFRPLVYVHPAFQRALAQKMQESFFSLPVPDLFVYSCLMPKGVKFTKGEVLYQDKKTRIRCILTQPLPLNRQRVRYQIDRKKAHFGRDPRRSKRAEAQLMLVEVKSLIGMGEALYPVLYLEMENCNCFDEILSKSAFDVQYLCFTREGLAMGGCAKSVSTHIFEEARIDRARDRGFNPQYVVTWGGVSEQIFLRSAPRWYPRLHYRAKYIGERGNIWASHRLYQLY